MKRTLLPIVGYCITVISTTFLPDLILSLFSLKIETKKISIIIAVLLLIILILIRYILENRKKLSNSSRVKDYIQNNTINNFKLYAISSAYWQDFISSIDGVNIKNCTILIRNNSQLETDIFRAEVESTITKWKRLRQDGKIQRLIIVTYDHIPDNFFALIDDKIVITGLNDFDPKDSTQQYGSRNPQHIFYDQSEAKSIIKMYNKHFENYVNKYRHNTIYDSNNT